MTQAAALAAYGSNSPSNRNRIINGSMVFDQRNAGASVTATSLSTTYTLDRWAYDVSAASKISIQQNAGSVTPPVGFSNYLGVTSLAATSVSAGDYYTLRHRVEGFNFSDMAWGTANAATVTLSFWVRSSLTGTFGGAVANSAYNRSYPFSYTINSANTWEQKTVTIAGDTTGTWIGATNGLGVQILFGLGVGSTYSGTANSWSGSTYFSATGATSVVGTSGATFYITGVQLEAGSVATPFEHRQYGTELQLAQRYFAKLQNDGSGSDVTVGIGVQQSGTGATFYVKYPVTMRAEPTASSSSVSVTDHIGFTNAATLTSTSAAYDSCSLSFIYASAGAVYRPIFLDVSPSTTGFIAFSAEL